MTNYKCGIYTKKEDYSKLAIRGIVFGSIWLSVILIVTASWLAYLGSFSIPNEPDALEEIRNQTKTASIIDETHENQLIIQIMATGMIVFALGPTIIGIIVGWFIADFIYKLLGLHEWNVYTCRCCGKKVGEHEKTE